MHDLSKAEREALWHIAHGHTLQATGDTSRLEDLKLIEQKLGGPKITHAGRKEMKRPTLGQGAP